MKIAIVCGPTSRLFLPPVEKLLRGGGHETRRFTSPGELGAALAWGDAFWYEWCDSGAVRLSECHALDGRPLVIRLHRYEAWTPHPALVDWSVATLVVTSHHVARHFSNTLPLGPKFQVIPSFIDFNAFTLQPREDVEALRIAVVGYFSGRKQPALAMAAMHALAKGWRVEGEFIGKADPAEPWWHEYISNMRTDGLTVHMTPWAEDPASIWRTHDACLSASAHEGCPYNVIEAMACGAFPLVHEYEGAAAQFGPFVWRTFEDLERLVDRQFGSREAMKPEEIRAWAARHYSIESNRDAVLALFA